MNIPMLQACVDGYQERLFDQKCIAVQQGYWAGYFRSKRPKPLNFVLDKLYQDHQKSIKIKKHGNEKLPKPEVDVDRFMALEQKRMEYLANKQRK